MNTLFKSNYYLSNKVATLLGFVLFSLFYSVSAIAQTPVNSTPPEQANEEQPSVNTPPQPNRQSSKTGVEQFPRARQDSDRVYISDVYPEYCRSYFIQQDWVSLLEYQQNIARCLHGSGY